MPTTNKPPESLPEIQSHDDYKKRLNDLMNGPGEKTLKQPDATSLLDELLSQMPAVSSTPSSTLPAVHSRLINKNKPPINQPPSAIEFLQQHRHLQQTITDLGYKKSTLSLTLTSLNIEKIKQKINNLSEENNDKLLAKALIKQIQENKPNSATEFEIIIDALKKLQYPALKELQQTILEVDKNQLPEYLKQKVTNLLKSDTNSLSADANSIKQNRRAQRITFLAHTRPAESAEVLEADKKAMEVFAKYLPSQLKNIPHIQKYLDKKLKETTTEFKENLLKTTHTAITNAKLNAKRAQAMSIRTALQSPLMRKEYPPIVLSLAGLAMEFMLNQAKQPNLTNSNQTVEPTIINTRKKRNNDR